ncbi:hypothetical protein OAA34_00210 [bacterium]|nr:hypothetical protein [bacterium]
MARSAPKFRRFIESITIDNAGASYSSIPGEVTLFISEPSGSPESDQVRATATLDIQNGSIAAVNITEPGDGYGDIPEIYVQSGIQTGTSSLTFTGSADSRRDEGTYTGVAVTSMKDGIDAIATVVVDSSGDVTSVNVTTSGLHYMEGETVTITDIAIGGTNGAADMTFTVAQLKGGGTGALFTPVLQTIARIPNYFHDNMNYIVDSQIPEFIRDDYPAFAKFLKDYYAFMDLGDDGYADLGIEGNDYNQSPNYLLQELIDKLNLDHYDGSFLDPFLETYALDFPATAEVDKRLLIKNIRQFFEAKGSRRGVEEFFKLMYNEDVEVFLPSEFILKPSDGIWQTEVTIKVYANDEISPVSEPFDLRGRRVDIHYYESVASITSRKKINTSVTRARKVAYTNPAAYELTVDIPSGTVIPGPGVEGQLTAVIGGKIATVDNIGAADVLRSSAGSPYTITTGFTSDGNGSGAEFTITVDGSGAAGVTVDTVGDDYAPDETITIPDSLLGGGGAADLTFDVATITEGKIFSVTIDDGGAGYSANPSVVIIPTGGDTITTAAVIDTRLTDGAITSTVFVNNVQGVGYNNVPDLVLNTDSVRSWIGLEGVSDIISNKTAFLTRVLNSATLKTNTGTSDGGFSVGNTFAVQETGDILGVYAIDYFAEDYTLTGIENNALVRVKAIDEDNYPTIVEVVSTGTGFQRSTFDFILRSSNDETATITCNTGFSHSYPGSFKNSQGFVSDANKLQDNAVYQNFSYQIRAARPKTEWGELLDRIAHPAGMIAWTDLQIKQTVNMGAGYNATPDVIVFRLFAEIETPSVDDAPVLFFHKPAITDSVNWSDQRTGASDDTILLFPNLGKFETPSAEDAVDKFDVTMGKEDSVDWSEAVGKDFNKNNVTDSVDWSEVVVTLKFIFREPTDSVDMSETVAKLFEKNNITDIIDMADAVDKFDVTKLADSESVDWQDVITNKEPGLGKTEDPTVDESDVLLFGSLKTDTASFGESGQIIAQNYAGDYFAEDYVGEARNIS